MEHFIWDMNPIMLELGPIKVYWYGILFVGSFFVGLEIFKWIYKREGRNPEVLENLIFYVIAGAVIGSRLVHCFFYEPSFFLAHPLKILYIWEGGLASHGGMIGVLIALWFFTKRYNESYVWLMARIAIPGALTATAIRIGNFINSEILGKATDVSWAIVFQKVDMVPRHPVQLYEATAYIAIFLLLLTVYRSISANFATKILPPLFLVTLFTARFFLEYAKTRQATYTTDLPFSTGQMLSLPLVVIGLAWLVWAFYTHKKSQQ